MNITKDQNFILDLSQKATGQALISNQLDNIIKKWDEFDFVVVPLEENPDKYKLSQVDDII